MYGNGIRIVAAAAIMVGQFAVTGWAFSGPEGRGERRGPPPEAVAACQGKSEGATVEFTGRGGETISGTCRQFQGQLAAMPDRPPGAKGNMPKPQQDQ